MSVDYPKKVKIVELESAPFKCAKDAVRWAREHGIVGVMSNTDTGGKGEISISGGSLSKMLSGSAVQKSVTPQIHFSALTRLRDIIRESFIGEIHPDYNIEILKGNCRNASRPSDKTSMIDVDILLNGVCDVNGVPLMRMKKGK